MSMREGLFSSLPATYVHFGLEIFQILAIQVGFLKVSMFCELLLVVNDIFDCNCFTCLLLFGFS